MAVPHLGRDAADQAAVTQAVSWLHTIWSLAIGRHSAVTAFGTLEEVLFESTIPLPSKSKRNLQQSPLGNERRKVLAKISCQNDFLKEPQMIVLLDAA